MRRSEKIIKAIKYSRLRKMGEKELLVKEIENVRFLMRLAYFKLSIANENDLVEAAIFELRSLEVKHDYLLKRLKEVEE